MIFHNIAVFFGAASPNYLSKSSRILFFLFHLLKFFLAILVINNNTNFLPPVNGVIGEFISKFYLQQLQVTATVSMWHAWKYSETERRLLQTANLNFRQIFTIFLSLIVLIPTAFYRHGQELMNLIASDLIIKITCIRYILIIKSITSKFKVLNRKIKSQIMSHESFKAFIFECKLFGVDHNQWDGKFEVVMAELMREHSEIAELVPLVNDTFGARMLLALSTHFISLMHNSYVFFVEIETTQKGDVVVGECNWECDIVFRVFSKGWKGR